MNKRVHGFWDASSGFYLELTKTLREIGYKQSIYDPALFLCWESRGQLGEQILAYVDDFYMDQEVLSLGIKS